MELIYVYVISIREPFFMEKTLEYIDYMYLKIRKIWIIELDKAEENIVLPSSSSPSSESSVSVISSEDSHPVLSLPLLIQ